MISVRNREEQWAEDHGIHVGYCNRHKVKVLDETCDECEDGWVCPECGEVRYDDQRVENGMKCMVCTYDNKGGE